MFRTPINWLVIILVFAAFTAGILLAPHFTDTNIHTSDAFVADNYICPMHPHVHSDEPGSCPICSMNLVQYENNQITTSVYISPEVRHNFGVRTAKVTRGSLHRSINAYGYVQNINRTNAQPVKTAFSGTVTTAEQLGIGDPVQHGQRLFSVTSKDWQTLQENFITAKSSGDAKIIQKASQPLFQSGIQPKQLQKLNTSIEASPQWTVHASKSGILSKALPAVGSALKKNEIATAISELYPISAYAEIFEGQWRWLKVGQAATMRVRSAPETLWHGEVLDIEDLVTSHSRTIKVRTGFSAQKDIELRSGMHADITLEANPLTDVIRIPRDALIRTQSSQRVILVDNNNHYTPRKVQVGLISEQWAEIKSGLNVGDTIVVSGQFLIDSESTLKSALDRLQHPNTD